MASDDGFDEFRDSFDRMVEKAKQLGFNPLLSYDGFSPRIFALTSFDIKDGKMVTRDKVFAPKNSPVELMHDYFMKLVEENTKHILESWCHFVADVFTEGISDGVVNLKDCKSDEDIAKVFKEVLLSGVHMITKDKQWAKLMDNHEIDFPIAIVLGQPDVISSMIVTSDSDLVEELNSSSVDDFIKEVLNTESEEE
ncbi:MAG: hypothetical protein CL508_05225 [Actinobacteria bacterium]|nr:hypothetical protein [Actinomycetota bacterium]MBO71699.1 hypothetical protein [Actinomycetota bacterium]|tara:strand:+ start:24467 stop:25054 length:588 start_codon:yes stop_codon:yes gene_type:complete